MRLSPAAVWNAHMKGLTQHPDGGPDRVARSLIYGLPVGVLIATFVFDGRLRQAGVLLAGSSLLAGTLLASFGQLAALRARVIDRGERSQVALDALDETAAHVLMAVYAAVVTAAELGGATAMSAGAVTGLLAAVGLGLASWLLLLVLLIVPRLYQAYTYAFEVRDDLNGYVEAPPR